MSNPRSIRSVSIFHDRVKMGPAGLDAAGQGGTVTEVGGNRIHTFLANGNFTVLNRGTFQYLIVGGGGGGGNGAGGGGGAGGLRQGSVFLEKGTYAVVVGAGGAGGPASAGVANQGVDGNPSSFHGVTSDGGAKGGATSVGGNGASGGGGSGPDAVARAGGSGVAGEGNNGGSSNAGTNRPGGGGGGAGAVGANATATVGGNGGAGVSSTISGAAVEYAGGGGGGTYNGGTAGTATGGGSAGSNSSAVDAADATDGRGGGGGGGASNAARNVYSAGGDGGDGVVIIAYPTPAQIDQRQAGFLLNLVDEESSPGLRDATFDDFSPEDRAEGGLYSVKFTLYSRKTVYFDMFERGLGRWVEVFGWGLEPEFEGMITEMVFILPPDRFTISLEPVANKAFMRADQDGDGVVDRSTPLQNLRSQEIYPITELVIGGGQVDGVSVANQAIQQYLNLRAFPRPSLQLGGATGRVRMEIFVRGFWWTLGRRVFNQTAVTGAQSMTSEARDILNASAEYVARQKMDANTTSVLMKVDADRKPWDMIVDNSKLGDSQSNRWLPSMRGRRVTNAVGRVFYLKQAAPPTVPPSI